MPILLGLAYVLALAAIWLGTPPALTTDASGTSVGWVATGSYAWTLDIRPGLALQPWPAGGHASGFTVDLGDGAAVEYASQPLIGITTTVGLTLLLLLVGVLARALGLPGWSTLLGLSAAAAVGPLAPALGYPPTLLVGLLPPAVTIAAIGSSAPELARPRYTWLALAVVVLGLALPAVATVAPQVRWPWTLLWNAPALTVLALGLLSALPLAARTLAGRDVGWPARLSLFVSEAFPIARSSRVAASAAERKRLAAELHNEVLPQISQALLEIDAHDPAGRQRLAQAVEQIRRAMAARQSLALEAAGVASAVAAYVATLDVGMNIDIEPHEAGRAPARTEEAAYRVAQLAIANAVQHSSGERIAIRIVEDADRLEVQVTDDGVGIDEKAARSALARGHVGLAAMRSEAAHVAARLDVRSASDRGTTVAFSWHR